MIVKTGTLSALMFIIGLSVGAFVIAPIQRTNSQSFPEDSAWRTNSISISGSTTVLPIADACAKTFMNKYSGTTITVQGGGSGQGYSQVIDGVVDIGDASRPPKQAEIDDARSKGVALWLHPIALDAVCVVINPSIASSLNLTLQEVGKIFAGIYTRWNHVKPNLPDQPIYVVVREPGSGTRGTFEEYTMNPWDYEVTDGAHVQQSNPEVKTTIENTPYAIGYVGYGFLSDKMVTVALAKSEEQPCYLPTLDNIAGFKYPISRYLYMVTTGQPASGSLSDRFIDFVLSPEGQTIVEERGFLKLPEYPQPLGGG